jgi:hypothetical protein
MERPPCFESLGLTDCLRRQHDWIVYGNGPLFGAWTGWRIAGDELISPDRDRIRLARVQAVARLDQLGRRKTSAVVVPFRGRQNRWTTP